AGGDFVSGGYPLSAEEAGVEKLEDGLRALSDLDARTYVPGHGPAGGGEILDEQARYHAAVAAAADVSQLRDAFPNHALAELLPLSVEVWGKRRKRGGARAPAGRSAEPSRSSRRPGNPARRSSASGTSTRRR